MKKLLILFCFINLIANAQVVGGNVPASRSLTINGVSYNLSANRTWTIPSFSIILNSATTATPSLAFPLSSTVPASPQNGWLYWDNSATFGGLTEVYNGTANYNHTFTNLTSRGIVQTFTSNVNGGGVTYATGSTHPVGLAVNQDLGQAVGFWMSSQTSGAVNGSIFMGSGTTQTTTATLHVRQGGGASIFRISNSVNTQDFFNIAAATGNATFSNTSTTFNGIATITGSTSLASYSASGTGTVNALIANTTLSVGTNLQATGTMSITGASTLTGAIRASSNLSVTGTFSMGGASTTNGITNTGGITTSTTFSCGTTLKAGTTSTMVGVATFSASINSSVSQSVIASSTSGSVTASQPLQGTSWKKVIIYCTAALGTASYTFPTAFINTPAVITTNGPAASVVTGLSTTSVTITGATTTGFIFIEGY